MIPRAVIEKLPKTDLHVHLDGSIRLGTLIELAQEAGVQLPAETPEGLRETVFRSSYESLVEYLRGFAYTVAVLQRADALERAAYEFARDNQAEGVRYVEVRFAPQLHVNAELTIEDVLHAVDRGMRRAKDEYNRRAAIADRSEPPFEYSIIVCALRYFGAATGAYYGDLLRAHRFSPPKRVYALASTELAEAAVFVRDEYGIPITGFDLAGAEAGYPAEDHVEAFQFAHENFLMKTVHAGEAYGPESIFQAITQLHADRIGHGTLLLDTSKIENPAITDRGAYVAELTQYIADRRITIEVCLTSNLQTIPEMGALANHPFGRMREHMLSATLCTDNRTVSNTTVTDEIERATAAFGLSPVDVKRSVVYGFKRSFYPGTYLEKRRYVRQVMDYYASLEEQHAELRAAA
ncbi:MAG: adenosine deaminase [Gaiellales bacterium]